MSTAKPHFLLVGNGPYANRGCEAIVRGTAIALKREFGEGVSFTVASLGDPDLIARQATEETDPTISHVPLDYPYTGVGRVVRSLSIRLLRHSLLRPWRCRRALANACVALQIGGDNYSLDYGLPTHYLMLDRYIQRRRVPVCLWGASVGPFDSAPHYAEKMFAHLRTLNRIFVREPASYQYLGPRLDRTRLVQMADPALLMPGLLPTEDRLGFKLPEAPVGLNFSPLLAAYATKGDMRAWIRQCADITVRVADRADRDVILVPHVIFGNGQWDDLVLLRAVEKDVASRTSRRVTCLPGHLTAAETKGVISQCSAFAGARFHSTIAALSSGVPTLSFAYSIKGIGLTLDLYDSLDFCLKPADLHPDAVAERIAHLIADRDSLSSGIKDKLTGMRERVFGAARCLRDVMYLNAPPQITEAECRVGRECAY